MAKINRSDVIQKAVNDLALSTATDKIPSEILDKVQLTYDLNRKFSSFVVSNTSSSTGNLTVTMPTVDERSEIYLTTITMDMVKDATCDVASGSLSLTLTPDRSGIATSSYRFAVLTATAQDKNFVISLPYPLRLKPNTNLVLSGSFTAGAMVRTVSLSGFITSSN